MAKWLKLYAMYTFFHLTWPTSPHYLIKSRCSTLLPNTGFITECMLRFDVKVKWHTVATTFLLRGHCQTCTSCPRTSLFCVSTGRGAPLHREHNTVAFLER